MRRLIKSRRHRTVAHVGGVPAECEVWPSAACSLGHPQLAHWAIHNLLLGPSTAYSLGHPQLAHWAWVTQAISRPVLHRRVRAVSRPDDLRRARSVQRQSAAGRVRALTLGERSCVVRHLDASEPLPRGRRGPALGRARADPRLQRAHQVSTAWLQLPRNASDVRRTGATTCRSARTPSSPRWRWASSPTGCASRARTRCPKSSRWARTPGPSRTTTAPVPAARL